jgi:hypothetical protein
VGIRFIPQILKLAEMREFAENFFRFFTEVTRAATPSDEGPWQGTPEYVLAMVVWFSSTAMVTGEVLLSALRQRGPIAKRRAGVS